VTHPRLEEGEQVRVAWREMLFSPAWGISDRPGAGRGASGWRRPALRGRGAVGRPVRPGRPERFSVAAVVRNDRDGSLRVEGRPRHAPQGFRLRAERRDAGPGRLARRGERLSRTRPSRFDVIELRVFDHKSRKLITSLDGMGASYYPSSPPVVQVRGLGKRLPDSVDVWFRASSHELGEPVVALKGEAGASATSDGRSVSVREAGTERSLMRRKRLPGRRESSTSGCRFRARPTARVRSSSTGRQRVAGRYQICAVGRDGRKVFANVPHFLNFQATPGTEAIHFQLAPGELSHFELRRLATGTRSIFDDVKLPNASTRPFREAAGRPGPRGRRGGRSGPFRNTARPGSG